MRAKYGLWIGNQMFFGYVISADIYRIIARYLNPVCKLSKRAIHRLIWFHFKESFTWIEFHEYCKLALNYVCSELTRIKCRLTAAHFNAESDRNVDLRIDIIRSNSQTSSKLVLFSTWAIIYATHKKHRIIDKRWYSMVLLACTISAGTQEGSILLFICLIAIQIFCLFYLALLQTPISMQIQLWKNDDKKTY